MEKFKFEIVSDIPVGTVPFETVFKRIKLQDCPHDIGQSSLNAYTLSIALDIEYVEGVIVLNGKTIPHSWNRYKGQYFDVTNEANGISVEKYIAKRIFTARQIYNVYRYADYPFHTEIGDGASIMCLNDNGILEVLDGVILKKRTYTIYLGKVSGIPIRDIITFTILLAGLLSAIAFHVLALFFIGIAVAFIGTWLIK